MTEPLNDTGCVTREARARLVDPDKLRLLVHKLDLDAMQKEFIEARWLNYVIWWDCRASDAKNWFQSMQAVVVIASALVPAFIALRELKAFDGGAEWIFSIAAIIASLAVAVFAGLERLLGYGDIWREKRNAAEIIKSEGFSFFELCGPYAEFASHKRAFKRFADNVEKIIRNEIHEYVSVVGSRSQSDSIESAGKGSNKSNK